MEQIINLLQDNKDIYSSNFIKKLFDEMSSSYNKINLITSLGLSVRWRKQCINQINFYDDMVVYDLMAGRAEAWPFILKKMSKGKLIGLDISPGMLNCAKSPLKKNLHKEIKIVEADILKCELENEQADCVLSLFGLKTFSEEQVNKLLQQVRKVLKPGGVFSFIEISIPENRILRILFMFYLKKILPFWGKIFLNNSENFKMLEVYTRNFKNCKRVMEIAEINGFSVNYHSYFFGFATGIYGIKNNK